MKIVSLSYMKLEKSLSSESAHKTSVKAIVGHAISNKQPSSLSFTAVSKVSSEEERMLYPVKALKAYLQRTKGFIL